MVSSLLPQLWQGCRPDQFWRPCHCPQARAQASVVNQHSVAVEQVGEAAYGYSPQSARTTDDPSPRTFTFLNPAFSKASRITTLSWLPCCQIDNLTFPPGAITLAAALAARGQSTV